MRMARSVRDEVGKSEVEYVVPGKNPFCIVLTSEGNLAVVEFAEYSLLRALLRVRFVDDHPKMAVSAADRRESENLSKEGWELWQQRKFAEAEVKFEEAVEKDSGNENAWQGLGWAQFNQGKNLNAKDSFEKCIALNPKNSAALNGLGWIANGAGNKDEAVKWWEKAVDAQAGATASLSGLTQVYMERGDYEKAAKYYRMWLEAEPDNKDAKNGLEKAEKMSKEK